MSEIDLIAARNAIIDTLPTRAPIYLPTEKVTLEDQIKGLSRVKTVYQDTLDGIYRPRLKALRKRFKGQKRCFIIGNGPSLNDTDLSLLKDEVTFAVNGFFLKSDELNWRPTFYMVEDHLVAEDRADALNALRGSIKMFPAYLAYCMEPSDDTIFFNHRPRKSYPDGFDFSTDAAKITYTGCTVTFTALQMAAYLGFEDIYLIGVDASYDIPKDAKTSADYDTGVLDMKSDDPNHFHPDYFGKGFRWHDPQVPKMLEAYAQAQDTIETTEQRIINATVGGMLEVFPRADYASLFSDDKAKSTDTALPKTLLIDFTKIGGGTATGEIKATYFQDWLGENLLHIFGNGREGLGVGDGIAYRDRAIKPEVARKAVAEFAPEIIFYRPVGDNRALHEFAMQVIAELKIPHVIWLMDDWPARLFDTDPKYGAVINADLVELCTAAAQNFAISDAMAGAFGARYGSNFHVFHNGIAKKDWEAAKPERKKGFVRIRYAGGLAPDMTLDSITDVADAVENLAKSGTKIELEILTHPHWLREQSMMFDDNPYVSLAEANLSNEAYRQWLLDADILLIANNFDEASYKYIRYSFANKMPEYLATGAAVLAYGPPGLASMDILDDVDGVTRVKRRSQTEFVKQLTALSRSARTRTLRGNKSKAYAFKNFDINTFKQAFKAHLFAAKDAECKPLSYDSKRFAIAPAQADIAAPAYVPKSKRVSHLNASGTVRPLRKKSLVSHFLRYSLGWKGIAAILAASLTVMGVSTLTGAETQPERYIGAGMIFIGQIANFALVAHLAAHVNRVLDR